MAWWGNRRDKDAELRQRIVERARLAGGLQTEQPAEPELTETRSPAAALAVSENARDLPAEPAGVPGESGPEPRGTRAERAVAASRPAEHASVDGSALTYHVNRMDARTLIGVSRRKPQKAARVAATYYLGRQLTTHSDRRNRRTPMAAAQKQLHYTPVWRRLLEGLVYFLKWLLVLKPRILIIERYIWSEALGFFLVGAFAFTIFMIVTTIFSLGEKVFSKSIPAFTVTKVLLLFAPAFLVLAIPVAILFATLMALNRLNRDNEIVAMTTNGISLYRLFVPFIALAVGAGIMTWSVYEYVVPRNNLEQRETLKVFWEAQVVQYIKPQTVIKAPDRKYFYVESINKTEGIMYGLRLYDYFKDDRTSRNYPRIFIAERAWIRDSNLVLDGVTLYELDETNGNTLVEAKMNDVSIDIATKLSEIPLNPDPTVMTSGELRDRIARDAESISARQYIDSALMYRHNKDITEYYFKFSIPFACLAFVLVAVPVSLRGPRDERNMGIIMSFLLVMAYYIIFFVCREVGGRGVMLPSGLTLWGQQLLPPQFNAFPGIVAGWMAPTLFVIAGSILIAKARK